VDEFSSSEESVHITNLQPGTFYGIRAIATNTINNLSSQSRLIQVQTIPITGHERSRFIAASDQAEIQSQGKENEKGRRSSAAIQYGELANSHNVSSGSGSEDPEPEENMKQLTRKLDVLRQRQEETDRQIAEDIAENEKTKAVLSRERDELKQRVEEKEKAHLELKKQVNETEKQCKAAQRKKSAKERLLQQKKAERQKKLDEIALWKKECCEMRKENQALERERAELEGAHQKKMAEIRRTIDEANADNKTLEEEIRLWGIKIKALEEERRKTDNEEDEEAKEAERREKEEEEAHEKRLLDYQTQIEDLWKANQQVGLDSSLIPL
jgi:chromosome segregation ATPase